MPPMPRKHEDEPIIIDDPGNGSGAAAAPQDTYIGSGEELTGLESDGAKHEKPQHKIAKAFVKIGSADAKEYVNPSKIVYASTNNHQGGLRWGVVVDTAGNKVTVQLTGKADKLQRCLVLGQAYHLKGSGKSSTVTITDAMGVAQNLNTNGKCRVRILLEHT